MTKDGNQGSAAVKRAQLCRIAQMRYTDGVEFLNLRDKGLDLATQAAEGMPRRRFTVAELEAMVAAGILEEDERACANLCARAGRQTVRA
jgi:hypothetical protein